MRTQDVLKKLFSEGKTEAEEIKALAEEVEHSALTAAQALRMVQEAKYLLGEPEVGEGLEEGWLMTVRATLDNAHTALEQAGDLLLAAVDSCDELLAEVEAED
jgi:hypothetical protein